MGYKTVNIDFEKYLKNKSFSEKSSESDYTGLVFVAKVSVHLLRSPCST